MQIIRIWFVLLNIVTDQISSNKGYFSPAPLSLQPSSYQFVDGSGTIVESNK